MSSLDTFVCHLYSPVIFSEYVNYAAAAAFLLCDSLCGLNSTYIKRFGLDHTQRDNCIVTLNYARS